MATTIMRVNFELTSDLMAVQRREFEFADRNLTNPENANCVIDGEFFTFNSQYKLIRAALITDPVGTAAPAPGSYNAFPLFVEKGRYDVQIRGAGPVIYLGHYEADTRIYDTLVGAFPIVAVNQPLKVATLQVDMGGGVMKAFSGLIGHGGAADPAAVAGYVTRLPATNGGKLRYRAGTRNF